MKAESTTLVGQRERCHEERKRRQRRPWIFFLVFCCSSNVLIAGFVFTVSFLMWVWVLFNGISTSVDHLMPEGLNLFGFCAYFRIRVWFLVGFYYIWIDFDWFGLIWFYSMSTISGYSMPNPFLYIYEYSFLYTQ